MRRPEAEGGGRRHDQGPFLYPLLLVANLQLETLFSDEKLLLQKDHRHVEQLLLLLRLEGTCSILSIASILQALEYHPNSVGYLRQCFPRSGQALPSPLSMPSPTLVFSLSDEIFALYAPILVTIDARSTAILTIELASDRSAETWRAHFEALEDHQCSSLGLASERGLGLVAGYHAACAMALWVCDNCTSPRAGHPLVVGVQGEHGKTAWKERLP